MVAAVSACTVDPVKRATVWYACISQNPFMMLDFRLDSRDENRRRERFVRITSGVVAATEILASSIKEASLLLLVPMRVPSNPEAAPDSRRGKLRYDLGVGVSRRVLADLAIRSFAPLRDKTIPARDRRQWGEALTSQAQTRNDK